jgi:hypothetical protein
LKDAGDSFSLPTLVVCAPPLLSPQTFLASFTRQAFAPSANLLLPHISLSLFRATPQSPVSPPLVAACCSQAIPLAASTSVSKQWPHLASHSRSTSLRRPTNQDPNLFRLQRSFGIPKTSLLDAYVPSVPVSLRTSLSPSATPKFPRQAPSLRSHPLLPPLPRPPHPHLLPAPSSPAPPSLLLRPPRQDRPTR